MLKLENFDCFGFSGPFQVFFSITIWQSSLQKSQVDFDSTCCSVFFTIVTTLETFQNNHKCCIKVQKVDFIYFSTHWGVSEVFLKQNTALFFKLFFFERYVPSDLQKFLQLYTNKHERRHKLEVFVVNVRQISNE